MSRLPASNNRLMRALSTFTTVAGLLLLASPSWARITIPEGMEDLHYLGDSAPFVFHATVETVGPGAARLRVDRWYKGKPQAAPVWLEYRFSPAGSFEGHDCINLSRTDSWLIFARQESSGMFQFSHDC